MLYTENSYFTRGLIILDALELLQDDQNLKTKVTATAASKVTAILERGISIVKYST